MKLLRENKMRKFLLGFCLVAVIMLLPLADIANAGLRNPDYHTMQDRLTPMQYSNARNYLRAITKTYSEMSETSKATIVSVEKWHDFVSTSIDLLSMGMDIKSFYGDHKVLGYDQIGIINNLFAAVPLRDKLIKYAGNRETLFMAINYTGIMLEQAAKNGLGGDPSTGMGGLVQKALGADTAENMHKAISSSDMPLYATMITITLDAMKEAGPMPVNNFFSLFHLGEIGFNVTNLKSLLPIYYYTKLAQIATDLISAKVATGVVNNSNTKQIALDFLEYYYIAYGGDRDQFYQDMGKSPAEYWNLARGFKEFTKQIKNGTLTFADYYGPLGLSGWVMGEGYKDEDAIKFILDFLTTPNGSDQSGMGMNLAVRLKTSDNLAVGRYHNPQSHFFISAEIEPLLSDNFYLQTLTIQEYGPSGSGLESGHVVYQLFPTFAAESYTKTVGSWRYLVNFTIVQNSTAVLTGAGSLNYGNIGQTITNTKDFTWVDDVRLNVGDIQIKNPQIQNIKIALDNRYVMTFDAIAPADIFTYKDFQNNTVSLQKGFVEPVFMKVTDLATGSASDWQRLISDSNPPDLPGKISFSIPIKDLHPILVNSGIIGTYKIELSALHPHINGELTKGYNFNINYGDLSSTSLKSSDIPHFQIIVANKAAAAFDANDNSFYAKPGDKIRLMVKNVEPNPFASLAGQTIRVIIYLPDGKDTSTNGALVEGGIEFTINKTLDDKDMPEGRYRIITVMGIAGDGAKNVIPPYAAQQLIEAMQTGGGGGETPPVTGAVELPRTGQTGCWDAGGNAISCAGTGQDGEKRAGEAWPVPRFSDNGDQTMTDNLTGLIWTKDGNAPGPTACGPATTKTWQGALDYVACLNSNNYLNHGDWRLPNRKELKSLVNRQEANSATWLNTQGFSNVQSYCYWSSSTLAYYTYNAWIVHMNYGYVYYVYKTDTYYVWPVRGGQ